MATTASKMNQALFHRGPDAGGEWVDPDSGIALCHRRLSILDLSPTGAQPMLSSCGRYVMVFNGEIYNFGELREKLRQEGKAFRGGSDTEVLLEAVASWGLTEAISRSNGMFAFAVWDRREKLLMLARDRLGIKPLYYGWAGSTFLFASEAKAFAVHDDFQSEINPTGVGLLLKYGYIPAPHSIWSGIHKLAPGDTLVLKFGSRSAEPRPYWKVDNGVGGLRATSEDAAADIFHDLLRDAVRLQMIADVPLGAFLSGGVDSSTIVALMQSQSTQPIRTFSIGFGEKAYNEAEHARLVADHLGTDHTELTVKAKEALNVIPNLPAIFDEPFADSSQIPTLLLSQLTRRHVKVCLSGDGGDELFAGYEHYRQVRRRWKMIECFPQLLRKLCAKVCTSMPEQPCDRLLRGLTALAPGTVFGDLSAYKFRRFALALGTRNLIEFYDIQISKWLTLHGVLTEAFHRDLGKVSVEAGKPQCDPIDSMARFDLVNYLPEDVLTKVDRASMSVALETRVPLLDHRVVEFALQQPLNMKIQGRENKRLLRKVLHRYLPPSLFERPKMGFRVPIAEWLRGPLRPWAEELLQPSKLESSGIFVSGPIRAKWTDHIKGIHNWEHLLWSVLMFQAWQEKWGRRKAVVASF